MATGHSQWPVLKDMVILVRRGLYQLTVVAVISAVEQSQNFSSTRQCLFSACVWGPAGVHCYRPALAGMVWHHSTCLSSSFHDQQASRGMFMEMAEAPQQQSHVHAHFKPLLMSHLLKYCCSWQVTWLSQGKVWRNPPRSQLVGKECGWITLLPRMG